jgi:mTERF
MHIGNAFSFSNTPRRNLFKDMDVSTNKAIEKLERELKIDVPIALRDALDSCQELRQSIDEVDLSEWRKSMGKFSNLQMALKRHPKLMAGVLKSKTLITIEHLLQSKALLTEDQLREKLGTKVLDRKRLRGLLNFLGNKLGCSSLETRKIMLSYPKLLSYNVKRFEEVFDYLVPYVDARLMIKRWPILLTYSVQGRIHPGVIFLQSLGDTRWNRILLKYPQVVTHSVENVLMPRLQFLERMLNIPSAKQLVTHYPPLLWLSSDLIEAKFLFLQESLDLTQEETEMIIETYPQILGLSVDNNLKIKISYLQTYLSTEQLRDIVLYQPALLAYSLERRIRPRLEQLRDVNIEFAYAPAYLMSMTDDKFQAW